jgi:hypothetical protein
MSVAFKRRAVDYAQLTGLRHLSIGIGTDLTAAEGEQLAGLRNLVSLRLLGVSRVKADLSFLRRLVQLHALDLSGTSPDQTAVVHLTHLPHLRALKLPDTLKAYAPKFAYCREMQ